LLNNRAVSEVVGALLMIALTVTAGVIVYVYSSGLIGPLQGAQVRQPYMEKITLDYYQWTMVSSANGTLTLILRNTGSIQLKLADFFIAGNAVAPTFGSTCPAANINVNSPGCQVTLSYTGQSFTSGIAYNVRVVTADGALFDYACVAGMTS